MLFLDLCVVVFYLNVTLLFSSSTFSIKKIISLRNVSQETHNTIITVKFVKHDQEHITHTPRPETIQNS